MENYIVSARKYRPSTFASVVGQKALTSTLKNAIATDRLAHAYLFCGSRGVGKTSCARIFAKTINCTNPTPDGDPCNECDSCRAFNENRSLNIIELDAASNNSVDDIRQLVEQVQVPPSGGKYRVFIIDEVHMLSSAAFNAFLKTLEEPPSYVIFILATTEKHKIIPTILSRCQIYDFNRITIPDIIDHLAYVARTEGIEAERSALGVIASKADGAMRDALSIFDQVAASSRGKITYQSTVENLNVLDTEVYNRLMQAFINKDVASALLIYKEVRDRGFDSHHLVNGLAAYIRDLMVARTASTRMLVDMDTQSLEEMAQIAADLPVEFFYDAMSLCNDCDLHYREASSKTFIVELLLIRLCQLLGPSQSYSGVGEGQLQPIAAAPTQSAQTQPQSVNTVQPRTAQSGQVSQTAQSGHSTQSVKPVSLTPPVGARVACDVPPVSTRPEGVSPRAGVRRVLRATHAGDNAQMAHNDAPVVTQNVAGAERKSPFTRQQLLEAWEEYAVAHPRSTILVNTMRACLPEAAGSQEAYDVKVENPMQVDIMRESMVDLLAYLRGRVDNDSLTLNVTLSDSGPAPHIWNDREILQHLIDTTPNLAPMMEKLGLKLL